MEEWARFADFLLPLLPVDRLDLVAMRRVPERDSTTSESKGPRLDLSMVS